MGSERAMYAGDTWLNMFIYEIQRLTWCDRVICLNFIVMHEES